LLDTPKKKQVNVLSTKANTHTESDLEQAMLQTVFDSVPEAVIVIDTQGKVLLANPAANQLYGSPIPWNRDFNADGALQFYHSDGAIYDDRALPLLRSAFDGCVCENIEMIIARPDGRHADVLANTAPILDRHGDIAGAVGVFRNVTADKITQTAHHNLLSEVRQYVLQLSEANAKLETQSKQLYHQKADLERLSSELSSKSAFLETVFEQMPAGVFIAEAPTGKIIFANKRVNEIVGQPLFPMSNVQDLLNVSALRDDGKPFGADDRPVIRSLRNGETVNDEELRFNRPDGSCAIAVVNSAPVLDAQGNIVAAVVIFQDITEKKRVEAELRKHKRNLEALVSERTVELKIANERLEQEVAQRRQTQEALIEQSAILEALFSHAPLPLAILDKSFNFIRANLAYAKADKRDVSFFTGKNHFELYPDAENKAIFETVVETKRPFHVAAKPFIYPEHPDWGTSYWDWSLVPIMDKKGEVELLIFSLNDVTQHKKAQDELSRLSQFRETVIDTADIWLFVTDENNNILIWNRAAEKISGYSRHEVVGGKKPWPFLYPDPNYRKKIDELFFSVTAQGKVLEDFETEIHTKSSESRTILWNARPLAGPCGKRIGFMAVGKDITDRKQMDEKMRRYQRQLRSLASQMSMAEEQLRRRIASDLHDGLGQLLAISKLKLGQFRKNAAEFGLSGPLDEIHGLVEEAIACTRSLTVELSPPVLYELGFEAAIEWLCEQIQKRHNIKCAFKSEGLPETLGLDLSIMLFQIARELMHNVAKHAQACTASISVDAIDNNVRLNVVDDGVGFDMHEVASRPDHAGCFGLFNVRERLNHIGGCIEVSSAMGRGTRVTVFAPIKPS
jgi:PAS domain S-box-containing protein